MTVITENNVGDRLRFRKVRRFLSNPLGVSAALVLVAITTVSLMAGIFAPHDPNFIDLSKTLLPPGPEHPFGTDVSGRDILSRLLWGGQVSLQAGAIMIATAIVCGVPTGLIAGYFSKWFDGVANWFANMLMSLPEILIIIVVITSLGSGLPPTMMTLGVLASPDLFRLTRSVVVNVRDELYVDAARVSGLSDARIIFKHILTVILGPLLVRSSFVFGLAIIVQSGLEFLGFGDPTRPSWGGMLSTAFQSLYRAPELVIAPGAAIGLTVMCLVVFGAALADALGADRGEKRKTSKRARSSAAGTAEVVPSVTTPVSQLVASPNELLRVENLRVNYPGDGENVKEVVRGISLHVNRGEVLGLVGESGSGKSQTSFAILGLLPPEARVTATIMTLDQSSLLSRSEHELQKFRGTRMAYVPQEPMSNLDPSFTIGTQLTKPMRYKLGISKAEATKRARALLDQVGIPDPVRTMAAYPHQLSGGMAQRVLIAGAVSCDPELLVADEPTTALDVTVQADVLNLLRELQQERNMGMILVTHNFGVVADICDRVAVMQEGEIVEQREVRELFENPQHSYTKMLLDSTLEDVAPRALRSSSKAGS